MLVVYSNLNMLAPVNDICALSFTKHQYVIARTTRAELLRVYHAMDIFLRHI